MVTACGGCPKPKPAIPVEGLDCAGQKVTIINPPSKPAPTQTVAHPDSVQRVLICNPESLGGGGTPAPAEPQARDYAEAWVKVYEPERYISALALPIPHDIPNGVFSHGVTVRYVDPDSGMNVQVTYANVDSSFYGVQWGYGAPPATLGAHVSSVPGWYLVPGSGGYVSCLVENRHNEYGFPTSTWLLLEGGGAIDAATATGYWGYGAVPLATPARYTSYHPGWRTTDAISAIPCLVEMTRILDPYATDDFKPPSMRIIYWIGPGSNDYYIGEPGVYGETFGLGDPPASLKPALLTATTGDITGNTPIALASTLLISKMHELEITHVSGDPVEYSTDGGVLWNTVVGKSLWRGAKDLPVDITSIVVRGSSATAKYNIKYTY